MSLPRFQTNYLARTQRPPDRLPHDGEYNASTAWRWHEELFTERPLILPSRTMSRTLLLADDRLEPKADSRSSLSQASLRSWRHWQVSSGGQIFSFVHVCYLCVLDFILVIFLLVFHILFLKINPWGSWFWIKKKYHDDVRLSTQLENTNSENVHTKLGYL